MDALYLHKPPRRFHGSEGIAGGVGNDALHLHPEHSPTLVDVRYGKVECSLSIRRGFGGPSEVEQQTNLQRSRGGRPTRISNATRASHDQGCHDHKQDRV